MTSEIRDAPVYFTCSICNVTSDNDGDVYSYGEWMEKQTLRVHYYCLLLSTDLPQRGGDSCGILGFLVRDIRLEVIAAAKRCCMYCKARHANISCFTCHKYFHRSCGLETLACRFVFEGDFRSYCSDCAPLDDYQRELVANPPQIICCDICFQSIGRFRLPNVVYGECCRKGFTHRVCMQRYALASGYYLRCIWCRNADFRNLIRQQNVFVPDRDALWERERNAFAELYRSHMRCDWEPCCCASGRDYTRKNWPLIRCSLCASFGAHRQCIFVGGMKKINKADFTFKCPTCQNVEKKLESKTDSERKNAVSPGVVNVEAKNNKNDPSFYMLKANNNTKTISHLTETPVFSDEESISSSSIVTVIASNPNELQPLVPKEIFKHPLQLKRCYSCTNSPEWFFLEIYEFDNPSNQNLIKCIGTVVLRFDIKDSRIQDKSQEALKQLVVNESDIYNRTTDCGIYAYVDAILSNLHINKRE